MVMGPIAGGSEQSRRVIQSAQCGSARHSDHDRVRGHGGEDQTNNGIAEIQKTAIEPELKPKTKNFEGLCLN